MQPFCPGCGQPSEDGCLCRLCSLKSARLLGCPDLVELTICPACGAKLVKGRWQITESTDEELAYEAVFGALSISSDLQAPKIDLQLMKRGATRYLARASLKGRLKDTIVEESCQIPVKVNSAACDRCSRMAGKYFEAVVQVRGSLRPPDREELEECIDIAACMAEAGYRSGDRLAFIQEVKETRGGIDLIVGSSHLGRQIGKAILQRFGGKTQESSKLVGKKDGKDVFRITILVRFPRLKKGDIVSAQGVLYEVTGFMGRKILLASLEGKRRTSMREEKAEELEVLGNRSDARLAVVVEKDENVLEILDPESYKTAFASKPQSLNVEAGQEVEVIRTGDGFIVLG